MEIIDIIKGRKIEANVDPGLNQTVADHKWYVDESIISNISYILDTSILSSGHHIVKFEASNSCGNTGVSTLEINVIEGEIMEKIETVVVNQPTVPVAIVLPYTGAAEVTVTDGINPVVGATLDLDGVPTGLSTGADGKASIPNVPYGTHTVKAIKV